MIKIKKFESITENDDFMTRLTISQEGFDGFGFVLGLYDESYNRIGSITYRTKRYLENQGYPIVNELHIGFHAKYQRKGYFEDAIIELLKYDDYPIYVSSGRVINKDVFKAIEKLDRNLLNVHELESGYGYIITLRI